MTKLMTCLHDLPDQTFTHEARQRVTAAFNRSGGIYRFSDINHGIRTSSFCSNFKLKSEGSPTIEWESGRAAARRCWGNPGRFEVASETYRNSRSVLDGSLYRKCTGVISLGVFEPGEALDKLDELSQELRKGREIEDFMLGDDMMLHVHFAKLLYQSKDGRDAKFDLAVTPALVDMFWPKEIKPASAAYSGPALR